MKYLLWIAGFALVFIAGYMLGATSAPTGNKEMAQTSETKDVECPTLSLPKKPNFNKGDISKEGIKNTVDIKEGNPNVQITQNSTKENVDIKPLSVHTEKAFFAIDISVPKEIAEIMKTQIPQLSKYLSDREKAYDDASDEEWAYNKKIELESMLNTHAMSDDIEILSLSCLQLMCEVIATIYSDDSWKNIDRYIYSNSKGHIESRNLNYIPSLTFQDTDGIKSYVYRQYEFSRK